MAALAATRKFRVPIGDKWCEGWDVTESTAIADSDEWVQTTLDNVDVAFVQLRGDSPNILDAGPETANNQLGTNGAGAGGAVGIQTLVAHVDDMDLLVIGD